jgi:hypothetical protein
MSDEPKMLARSGDVFADILADERFRGVSEPPENPMRRGYLWPSTLPTPEMYLIAMAGFEALGSTLPRVGRFDEMVVVLQVARTMLGRCPYTGRKA